MPTKDYRLIHSRYCALTNRSMDLDMRAIYLWEVWESKGYTQSDLELVIGYIYAMISKGRRHPESFRLYNLIDPPRFADDLCDARALARVPKVDKGKLSVLDATGRVVPDAIKDNTSTVEQVMRANEELKKLLDLRDSL